MRLDERTTAEDTKEPRGLKGMRQPPGKKVDALTNPTTSERPLRDRVTEVSDLTDVRVGAPLPLGTYALDEGVNFALSVSYTHLRAHETRHDLVCRLLLEKK